MTIAKTHSITPLLAGDGLNQFPYDFRVNTTAEFEVWYWDAAGSAAALLTYGTHFTALASGLGTEDGGSITMVSLPNADAFDPLDDGTFIRIKRNSANTQGLNMVGHGPPRPVSDEAQRDKAVLMTQDNVEDLSRTVRVPAYESDDVDMTIPAAAVRAGKFATYTSGGAPDVATSVSIGAPVMGVLDITGVDAGGTLTSLGFRPSLLTIEGVSDVVVGLHSWCRLVIVDGDLAQSIYGASTASAARSGDGGQSFTLYNATVPIHTSVIGLDDDGFIVYTTTADEDVHVIWTAFP